MKTEILLERADDLLAAVQLLLPRPERVREPLQHHRDSLYQATASVLDILSGVFTQLSLAREGGEVIDLFYAQCEPLSIDYLQRYILACQIIVKQQVLDHRSRFPYDAMSVRAQTLRCLLLESSSEKISPQA